MEGRDDRGAAPVIGFILIFAFLVLAFTIYQGAVVPDQNQRAEFEHSEQVQGGMQDLRNAILSAATSGTERTVSLELGAEYPRRAIARNLGYSGGSLRSTTYSGAAAITIANATALDRYGETADYWNATTRQFQSNALVYQPVYTFYSNAPETVYANTLAYNEFDRANLSITGQSLVNGDRITLVALAGNLSESGSGTMSIDPEAISASTNRIAIGNDTSPITITIPTQLDASWWNETLAEEHVSAGGNVLNVSDTGENQVSIRLRSGETYTLRMAKIGVGTGTKEVSAKYLTLHERPSRSVLVNTSHSITVEVRDRFNNPVSGSQVNASVVTGDGSFADATISTDANGQATFNYTTPPDSGSVDLRFNVSEGSKQYEVVWVNLSVSSPGGGGGDDGGEVEQLNPGNAGSIILDDQSTVGSGGETDVTLTLKNNTNSNDRVNITMARISFFFKGSGGGGDPTNADILDPDLGGFTPTNLGVGNDFKALNQEIPLNANTTQIELQWNEKVRNQDFYVISFKFSNGDTYTYFVSHP